MRVYVSPLNIMQYCVFFMLMRKMSKNDSSTRDIYTVFDKNSMPKFVSSYTLMVLYVAILREYRKAFKLFQGSLFCLFISKIN